MKKINILGTEYTIRDNEKLDNCDGRCDWTIQTIQICKELYEKPNPKEWQDKPRYTNGVLRHEIIHALAQESGMHENSPMGNELVIDWIASMYPKMSKLFKELDIEK